MFPGGLGLPSFLSLVALSISQSQQNEPNPHARWSRQSAAAVQGLYRSIRWGNPQRLHSRLVCWAQNRLFSATSGRSVALVNATNMRTLPKGAPLIQCDNGSFVSAHRLFRKLVAFMQPPHRHRREFRCRSNGCHPDPFRVSRVDDRPYSINQVLRACGAPIAAAQHRP